MSSKKSPSPRQLHVEKVGLLGGRLSVVVTLVSGEEPRVGSTLVAPDGSQWLVTGVSFASPEAHRLGKRLYAVDGQEPGKLPPLGTYRFWATGSVDTLVGKWGLYPWFPTDNEQLIWPSDLARFRLLLPYGRVFQCIGHDERFITIRYRDQAFRVSPELFQPVKAPAFLFDESVRLAGRPEVVGVIRDIMWHFKQNAEMYFLQVGGKKKPTRYFADELVAVSQMDIPSQNHPPNLA